MVILDSREIQMYKNDLGKTTEVFSVSDIVRNCFNCKEKTKILITSYWKGISGDNFLKHLKYMEDVK